MERNRGGRPRHPDILTPAEWRVLEELRRGGTNAEIAVRLGVSPNAVKYHISNMLGKLELEDRHALAAWQGEREGIRTRVRALLALPAGLSSLGRTIACAGAAGAGVAALATVAVVVIAVLRTGDDDPLSPVPPGPTQAQERTPQPAATEPGEMQLESGGAQVSAGGRHSCAVRELGEIVCWGWNVNGQADAPVGSFRSVSATLHRNCAVQDSGGIVCWGLNADSWPAGRYRSVSAGGSHTCAVRESGAITCWGRNDEGQAHAPAGTYRSVSATLSHSWAVRGSGAIVCWGSSNYGQADAPAGSSVP